jgi:hypothetical protein
MAFCSINNLATKSALQNQTFEKAGQWHSPDEDTEMKDKPKEADANVPPTTPFISPPTPATLGPAAMPPEDHPDATPHVDFRGMFKARQTQDKAMGGSAEKVYVEADFAVIAYCNNLLINASQAYRNYLFPVPADWPLTPAPEAGAQAVLQPYLRVDTNPAGKFENFGSLELGSPKELDDVICVSEYTSGDVDENISVVSKFVQLVKKGCGEWRVAVNSTEYREPSKAQQIFYAASKATPAQGAQFLDKGSITIDSGTPDEITVTWTPVPFEKRRYALFYVNLLKGGDLEAEKAKAREALSTSGIAPKPAAAAAVPAAAAVQRPTLQITHSPEKASGVTANVSAPIKAAAVAAAVASSKGKVSEVHSDEEMASQDNTGEPADERSSSSKSRKDKSSKSQQESITRSIELPFSVTHTIVYFH